MVPRCSFCDKPRDQVRKLILSRTPAICDGCVELAKDYIDGRGMPPAGSAAEGRRGSITARFPSREAELRLMREPCEFCRDLMARCQFTAYGHVICDLCVDLCVDILTEQG